MESSWPLVGDYRSGTGAHPFLSFQKGELKGSTPSAMKEKKDRARQEFWRKTVLHISVLARQIILEKGKRLAKGSSSLPYLGRGPAEGKEPQIRQKRKECQLEKKGGSGRPGGENQKLKT